MTWREIARDVHSLGLYVLPTVDPVNFSIERAGGGQVAWFSVDAVREFRWGWVEHADGQGRTDFRRWDEFRHALESHGVAVARR